MSKSGLRTDTPQKKPTHFSPVKSSAEERRLSQQGVVQYCVFCCEKKHSCLFLMWLFEPILTWN